MRGQTGDEPFLAGRRMSAAEAVAEALAVGERFARDEPVAETAPVVKKLTRMQRAVIELFAQGLDQAQIAERLGRSQAAVYRHTQNVLNDWGLTTYEELRERARGLGLHQSSASSRRRPR